MLRDFFSAMYELLISLYGKELGMYLYGWNGKDYNGPAFYIHVGLAVFIISFVLVILYYYLFDKPYFSRWYHWSMVLLVNMITNGLIAYFKVFGDLDSKRIPKDIIAKVHPSNCLGFAIDNVIWAMIVFTSLSFILRWKSRNCSATPIPR